jgi:hypothetical protein
MKKVIALTPLKDGMILPEDFLRAVLNQTEQVDLMVLTRPRKDLNKGIDRGWKSKTEAKNIMRENALQMKYDYFLLLNVNVILEHENVVKMLMDKLIKYDELGAIAYNVKKIDRKGHVDLECCLVKREILEKMDFKNRGGDCDCYSFGLDVNRIGKQIKYYEDV